MTNDCTYGVATVHALLTRFGLQDRWCYVDANGGYHGLSRQRVEALVSSADLFLDMGTHGLGVEGTWLDEAANAGLRVLVATEPGLTQMRMELKLAAGEALPQYDIYYTTGLNVGTAASPAPTAGRQWRPIVDPVVVDLFACHPRPPQAAFSTVMNWQSMPPVIFEGVRYGQKDLELPKFIGPAPAHPRPARARHRGQERAHRAAPAAGWQIRHALQVTASMDGYLAYIAGSQGEFGVCKHACVATNIGWFSERSAAYLASGRPVVMQDTGFSRHLPCGRGLFAVRTVEEAAAASMRSTPTGSVMRAGPATWRASIWTPGTCSGGCCRSWRCNLARDAGRARVAVPPHPNALEDAHLPGFRRPLVGPERAVLRSRVGRGGHLHDGRGAAPAELHHELAGVERAQRRPMADAEHRRLREPLAHQPIEARLRRLVHRRGRLVEKEPVGLLDQGPREGDALLLAGGELERPVVGLVEPPGEVGSPTASSASRRVASSTPPAGIG